MTPPQQCWWWFWLLAVIKWTRSKAAVDCRATRKEKRRPHFQKEEGTAYCPEPLPIHTHEHLISYCVHAKRSSTTIYAFSTTDKPCVDCNFIFQSARAIHTGTLHTICNMRARVAQLRIAARMSLTCLKGSNKERMYYTLTVVSLNVESVYRYERNSYSVNLRSFGDHSKMKGAVGTTRQCASRLHCTA